MLSVFSPLMIKIEGEHDNAGGIVTRYGMDSPAFEAPRGQNFLYLSRPAPTPTSHIYGG